jgi:uncharacterized lipoprotein YajG
MRILALLAAALLAACATPPNLTPVRPGMAVVESVYRSAGDSTAVYGNYPMGYLLTVRMADGSIQRLSSVSGSYQRGDRVEVTPEGKILISR